MFIHSGISKRSSQNKRIFNSLSLSTGSTLFGEWNHNKVVWSIRLFCVLNGNLPLFLKCLESAGNICFLLLYRKSLQTTTNTRQFNSVSWMNTLKTILLGSSVLDLEADISQYSVYCHSLWNVKTKLIEEECFKL